MDHPTTHARPRLVSWAVLAILAVYGRASADCRSAAQLTYLARSISSAFSCERHRLTSGTASCTPMPVLACAGSLVDDLIALAGTAGVSLSADDRRTLGPALRCQLAILHAVSRFARERVQSAAAGIPGRAADIRAQGKLRRLPAHCGSFGPGLGGATLPRVGSPCADVDGQTLASCIRAAAGARLEPVLRRSIKPSIVLILTDDQPATMLEPMAALHTDLIADRGVTFGRATGTTPLCAPSRASILTGRYAHGHGVRTNYFPRNFFAFDDSSTIATWLHGAGYRTGFFGKYINGYTGGSPRRDYTGPLPYVPPGWDEWHVFTILAFFDYQLAENDVVRSYGSADADYSTDVLAAKAVDFIRSSADRPFFMVFAPYAPHDPATPAPRHAGRYSGLPPWRPLNYDEADVSDKARWLRDWPQLPPDQVAFLDALYPKMLESLLAVDEGIDAIEQALRETGRDEDTLVVFTSDNGLSLGSHRWGGKICPYEECLRVPMVVRYPRLIGASRADDRHVANIDLAPTFAEFAGVVPPVPVDGVSLAPLLDGSASSWRTDILAEQWSYVPPDFRVIRNGRFSYIEYALVPPLGGQEAELYDLDADPYQMTSLDGDPAYADVQKELADRVRSIAPGWDQPPP